MFRKGRSRDLHEICTYMNGRAMEKLARPANERNLLIFYTTLYASFLTSSCSHCAIAQASGLACAGSRAHPC